MQSDAKNYDFVIHNEDFEKAFVGKNLTFETMISDAGRDSELLSGQWHFTVDQYDMGLRSKWHLEEVKDETGRYLPLDYDFEAWETVHVPSCWNMQKKEYFYYESTGIYTRQFKYFKKNQNERVFLKVGAASYAARLFLNKTFIGSHQGASTPFFVEVTDGLREMNRLFITVENRRRPDRVPMHNTDWFNYGGLYRDVELIRVPETFIKDYSVCLAPDSNYDKVQVEIKLDGSQHEGDAILDIPELGLNVKLPVKNGSIATTIDAKPELWSPENPKLYDVHIQFGQDEIVEQIGFRDIRTEGTDLLLNGQKIFLRGISCHEESLENGKAVTHEEIVETFTLAKEMNCNFMRLAHYPHTSKAAKLADKMGLLLWEEIPVYWSIAFENPATFQDAENQLAEMITRDKNRASVIIWSVGNENLDTDSRLNFMKELVAKVKVLDSSRLVSAACTVNKVDLIIEDRLLDHLDVIGINEYYGWYDPDFEKLPKLFENSQPTKPVIITEFGGGAQKGHRGTVDEYFTEDNQLDLYQKQISEIDKIVYIKGMTPWIFYDFRCPRRTNPFQDFYNRKGLLSEDKKHKKLAFFALQEYYQQRAKKVILKSNEDICTTK